MADPVNTFYGSHFYQLTYNPGTFEYTVGADLGAHAIGDDEGDLILANGTAGDGTEAINEALTLEGPSVPGVVAGFYSGQVIAGAPIISAVSQFYLVSDVAGLTGSTGTAVSMLPYVYPVCFLPGTQIATPDGERAIETLQIGDLISTLSGVEKPVKWIGRMSIALNRFNRETALPVCIHQGALGNGLPTRDLYVSNDHAFAIDGVLVNAGVMVNGTSIVRSTDFGAAVIDYFQVEVEGHDLLIAEGVAAETFHDDGHCRSKFDNAADFHARYPDFVVGAPMPMGRVTQRRQLPVVLAAKLFRRQAA